MNIHKSGSTVTVVMTDDELTDLHEELLYIDRENMEIVPLRLNELIEKMEHVPLFG